MHPKHAKRSWPPLLKGLLILALVLPLAACDNDVNLPTPPPWPTPPPGPKASQTVQVSGSLTAAEGACFEATVLWNGQEIPGGRTECREPGGCAELELWPIAFERDHGRHTVAFQVVRQSQPAQDYRVGGTVTVEMENGPKLFIPLEAKQATLAEGQSVAYEIDLR